MAQDYSELLRLARFTLEYRGHATYHKLITDLADAIASLVGDNEALERLRPHWAQGYSSDSIAAQTTTVALAGLWEELGVTDQTAALAKLRALLAAAAPLTRFVDMVEAQPIGLTESIYTIHPGTEWEAVIRLSDLRALRKAAG